jgi:O-antigen ligase
VLLGRAVAHDSSARARSAAEHCPWRWAGVSVFVVAYSWLIAMTLPYFSSLVGIVASSTYLVSLFGGCVYGCASELVSQTVCS